MEQEEAILDVIKGRDGKDVRSAPQFRDFIITPEARAKIDVEKRTVEVAFSSEALVERYWGIEILDHAAKSIRLDRLRDGAPLLLDHDTRKQIGVIESVKIGSDRVGRAVVRFGKSALAEEIFQDVLDAIRTKISVGYDIFDIKFEGEKDGVRTYRVIDWAPFEISFVAVPADNGVGVGREKSIIEPSKELQMDKELDRDKQPETRAASPSTAPPVQTVDVKDVENKAVTRERERVAGLTAIGMKAARFGGVELAARAVAEGRDAEWLNGQIVERAMEKPNATETGEIGMDQKEAERFSFVRAAAYLLSPHDPNVRAAAAFEIEASDAAAKKRGKAPQGLIVPQDVLTARRSGGHSRMQMAGNFSTGGALVEETLLTGSFVELLYHKLVLDQLGITKMEGLVGDVAIPRQTAGMTAYWVGEAEEVTESDIEFGQIRMSPKTVGGTVEVTRQLLMQSSMSIETMVRNDMATNIALAIDSAGLYGTGTQYQPLGLKYTTGVQTKDFAADTPTFAELVDMETKVAVQDADFGNLAYANNAAMRGSLKSTPKVAGQVVYLDDGKELNGYRRAVSNQIEDGDIFFGNWAMLVMGIWSGLDLTVNPYSKDKQGIVRITGFKDVDFANKRPFSFVRGNNNL